MRKSLSITKIREVAGTDKQGTNVFGMVTEAEQLGFTAKRGNRNCPLNKFLARSRSFS
ncbi:MAG: hypothetical protein K6B15_08080 [Parasporobacterium sp.]|nr:hypothetical protein [Parasporobacterium sp.]